MIFLIVECKVLDVGVHTLARCALDLQRGHGARHKAILGIVFAVTAGERATVDVHSRRVPAICPTEQRLVAHHGAQFLGQIGIPGLGQHHDAGERLTGATIEPSISRIGIRLERLVYRTDVVHSITGEVDELVVVVFGELVKNLVPLLVVVIKASHIRDFEAILRTENRGIVDGFATYIRAGVIAFQLVDKSRIGGFLPRAGGVVAILIRAIDFIAPRADFVGCFTVMLRESTGPVGTSQVGDIGIGCRIEQVGDGFAGFGIGGKCGGVHVLIVRRPAGPHCGIARLGHAIRHGLAFVGKDVIDGFIGIGGSRETVLARIENVGFRSGVVIGLELILSEGYGNGFAVTGFKLTGFGISDKIHRGLFHRVLLVIVSVRSLRIQFHNVLAGHSTGIGHGNSGSEAIV